jgi:hypothetical protein
MSVGIGKRIQIFLEILDKHTVGTVLLMQRDQFVIAWPRWLFNAYLLNYLCLSFLVAALDQDIAEFLLCDSIFEPI